MFTPPAEAMGEVLDWEAAFLEKVNSKQDSPNNLRYTAFTSRSAQGRWGGEGLGVGSPEERGGGGGRKQVLSGASNIQVMEANERARRGGGGQPYDYLVTRHRRRPG